MSSKALLPDAVGAINKRVRRSWSNQFSKNKTSFPPDDIKTVSPQASWGTSTTLVATNNTLITHKDNDENTKLPSADLTLTDTQILSYTQSLFPPIDPDITFPPLPRPVLIPRLNPGVHIPFARCYAPALSTHSITKPDFIAFLDSLNLIIRPHPAITVTEFAAIIVGFIPYDVAEGVGAGVEGLAAVAHIAATYRNIKKFFAVMNSEYFHPRGLHVKIINTKRLRREFKDKGIGKKTPLVLPLTEETLDASPQERCLRFLAGECACCLDFEGIPPPYHVLASPRKVGDQLVRESPVEQVSAKVGEDGLREKEGEAPSGNSQAQSEQQLLQTFQSIPQTRMERLAAWRVKHLIAKSEKQAKRSRKRAWKKHQKGKPLKENCDEKWMLNQLDWVFIQNLSEWEAQRAAKAAKKEEKKKKRQQRVWHRESKEGRNGNDGANRDLKVEGVSAEDSKEVMGRKVEEQKTTESGWRNSAEVVDGVVIDLPIRTIGTGTNDRASTWNTVR